MYVSMHAGPQGQGSTIFRLHALKMGDYYVGSNNAAAYEFCVPLEWNPHPACVAILETLSQDQDKPIAVSLNGERIRIDPILAAELFDCLFAFTIIRDHQ